MRLLRNRKGQSIVEITLMTPLILVALYVPFDFGMTIFTGYITQNAVRDGARIASTTDPLDNAAASQLASDVYNNLPQLLVSGSNATKRVTVNYQATGASNCTEYVEVIAQGTYNFFLYKLMALFGFSSPDGIPITRITRMRHESQPSINGGTPCTTSTATGSHP